MGKIVGSDTKGKQKIQQQLIDIINHVPAGVCLYRWDGTRLEPIVISDYYAEVMGTNGKEMMEKATGLDYEFVHPDDLPGLQQYMLNNLKSSGKNLTYKYRIWNEKKKDYTFIFANANTVKQDDGTLLVYIAFTDITNEMLMQKELEQSREVLEIACDFSGIWTFTYDTEKGLAYTGKRLQTVSTGFDLEEQNCRGEEIWWFVPHRLLIQKKLRKPDWNWKERDCIQLFST